MLYFSLSFFLPYPPYLFLDLHFCFKPMLILKQPNVYSKINEVNECAVLILGQITQQAM